MANKRRELKELREERLAYLEELDEAESQARHCTEVICDIERQIEELEECK